MDAISRYRGVMTATPTPLERATGKINRAAAQAHIERQIESGITGIVPIGGTGEFNSLTPAQRLEMVELTVQAAAGRVPVIPGVLCPGLEDTVEAANLFVKAGADAVMIVTPYYYRPTQAGIVEYFQRVGERVDADLVLYEIPYRTGVSLTPETVQRIVDTTRTVAMKACNLDLAQQMGVVNAVGNRIAILTGDESVFPLHIAMGAVGGMLAGSNIFPRTWNQILALASLGDLAGAQALHNQIKAATSALYSEPNPAPIKAAMSMLGVPAGDVIAPMLPASEGCMATLRQVLPAALELEQSFRV